MITSHFIITSLRQLQGAEKQLCKVNVGGGGGCRGQTPRTALAAGDGALQGLVNIFFRVRIALIKKIVDQMHVVCLVFVNTTPFSLEENNKMF